MDDEDDALLVKAADIFIESSSVGNTSQEPPIKLPRLESSTHNSNSISGEIVKKVISLHSILVNPKQKGNPLLKAITSVPWEFDDIVPDYVMGPKTCALFLSLRYHNMNPDYIQERLKLLGKSYDLRILLVLVDINDPHVVLKTLTRICLLADLTLMLAWNSDEAGKIIETYKIYENKPPDQIMEKVENDPQQKIINALSSIKPVNKTDAMTLLSIYGTVENIVSVSENKLAQCPGFGTRKASKLYKVLHKPFLKGSTTSKNINSLMDENDDDIDMTEIDNIIRNSEIAQ